MHDELNVRDLRFATADQFFAAVDCGANNDFLQLSAGSLNFSSTLVELPGVGLEWNGVGATVRSQEIYHGSALKFGFARRSRGPLKSLGHELDFGSAVVWPLETEFEYIAPTGLNSLVVHVDASLADLLGWSLNTSVWRQVPRSRLLHLEKTCRSATREARKWERTGPEKGEDTDAPPDALQWRDRILAALESALGPWLEPANEGAMTLSAKPHFEIVKNADRFFGQRDQWQPIAADALAETLGVSRRSLFRAFRNYLGMGPAAYLQIVRLHRLRDRLLVSSQTRTTVTQIAVELGFSHMGRLSSAYHRLFGEYPSETLRRQ